MEYDGKGQQAYRLALWLGPRTEVATEEEKGRRNQRKLVAFFGIGNWRAGIR
jgi:hypothetical protein